MTYQGMVRRYFPNASDDEVEFILWEKTGFPCFWRGDPVRCLAQQLRRFKESLDKRDSQEKRRAGKQKPPSILPLTKSGLRMRNSTQCPILDRLGIQTGQALSGAEI